MSQISNSYNKFETFPDAPYNCISYLLDNDEEIWKYLFYNDSRAYAHPNLTPQQKIDLVYNADKKINECRIFLSEGQDEGITSETSILRIFTMELEPVNYVWGHMLIGIQVYCHDKVNTLATYRTRTDAIIQRLIRVFNGSSISGVGVLYFDLKASSRCRSVIIGAPSFKGKMIIFSNNVLG